ncbi:hypothetical protein [Brasilonema sp. UFV-L1]|nr:hypothetical protein [Brasilonema sp. UFV-L1]
MIHCCKSDRALHLELTGQDIKRVVEGDKPLALAFAYRIRMRVL